ncbi:MAG: DNA repair protein RadA [SAR202 cluster bacterium Io17-Chloro-G9]|nr:MAG: DNA repair protein RadA [SAR202 cluster bacterium Io17-Chloro-G9]
MVGSKARQKAVFICQACGYQSPKWMGFCPAPSCGSASPLVETASAPIRPSGSRWFEPSPEPLQELSKLDPRDQARIQLPWQELNRVLGGGIVPGSVVLLAGEPGVGKSTLLLQIAQLVSGAGDKVLYVSGEESPHQVKLRSQRLGFQGDRVFMLSETDVDLVVERLDEFRPELAVIDSIQTLFSQDAPSGPGSVAQVRETGLRLMRWAKARKVPIFMAGHMTKDGSLAGPRVLEHMVDVVTYLESQDLTSFRILRNGKNRFGSTTEVGVFEMTAQGLVEVPDPSRALLSQRYDEAVGSVLIPVLEGSRPLLLEVQALTSPSQIPVPRRVVNGVDYNRLLMLTAVAGRRAGLELSSQDIIVSVAGGFRVTEPASDLAVVLALASSLYNRAMDSSLVAFGEVGLSGELRTVAQGQRRLQEAIRLGFSRCILPQATVESADVPTGMEVIAVRTLREALGAALGTGRRHQEVGSGVDG